MIAASLNLGAPHQPVQQLSRKVCKVDQPWPAHIVELLQMVRAICGQMGLQNIMADKEIRDLSQNTSIESLSQTLEDRLPGT